MKIISSLSTPRSIAKEMISDRLADSYARLSPAIYEMKREISIVPENHEEIMRRFYSDTAASNGFTLTTNGLTTNLVVPLVVLADLGTKKKSIPSDGASIVNYEIKLNPEKYLNRSLNIDLEYSGRIRMSYGKQELTMIGKWTYNGKIESVEVKVPTLPEHAADIGAEAQLKYFQLLTEAKKTKSFISTMEPPNTS